MSGSLKFFTYTADDNNIFALLRDESNVEAANTAGSIIITSAAKYKLPPNVTPRSAVFVDLTGRIRRDVVIMTAAGFAALDGSSTIVDQVSGETLRLKLKKGEVLQLPTLQDTGLNDGDVG